MSQSQSDFLKMNAIDEQALKTTIVKLLKLFHVPGKASLATTTHNNQEQETYVYWKLLSKYTDELSSRNESFVIPLVNLGVLYEQSKNKSNGLDKEILQNLMTLAQVKLNDNGKIENKAMFSVCLYAEVEQLRSDFLAQVDEYIKRQIKKQKNIPANQVEKITSEKSKKMLSKQEAGELFRTALTGDSQTTYLHPLAAIKHVSELLNRPEINVMDFKKGGVAKPFLNTETTGKKLKSHISNAINDLNSRLQKWVGRDLNSFIHLLVPNNPLSETQTQPNKSSANSSVAGPVDGLPGMITAAPAEDKKTFRP
jgi:hypothetical protein